MAKRWPVAKKEGKQTKQNKKGNNAQTERSWEERGWCPCSRRRGRSAWPQPPTPPAAAAGKAMPEPGAGEQAPLS